MKPAPAARFKVLGKLITRQPGVQKLRYLTCLCECGKLFAVSEVSLSKRRSCGCRYRGTRQDQALTLCKPGDVQGSLTLLYVFTARSEVWCRCRCRCGVFVTVRRMHFERRFIKQCSPSCQALSKCEYCGKEFPVQRSRKYCSWRCSSRNRENYIGQETKPCRLCSRKFTGPARQVYCSFQCRRKTAFAKTNLRLAQADAFQLSVSLTESINHEQG